MANIVRTSARREIKAHGIYLKEAADRLLAAGSGPVCPQRRTWRWVGFSAKWILSGLPIIRSEPDATFPRTVSGQLRGHRGGGIDLSFVRVDDTDGGVVDILGALLLDAWTCRLAIQREKSGSAAGLAETGDTPASLSVPHSPFHVVDHERFNRPFRRF